jgi:hypothetical protein
MIDSMKGNANALMIITNMSIESMLLNNELYHSAMLDLIKSNSFFCCSTWRAAATTMRTYNYRCWRVLVIAPSDFMLPMASARMIRSFMNNDDVVRLKILTNEHHLLIDSLRTIIPTRMPVIIAVMRCMHAGETRGLMLLRYNS